MTTCILSGIFMATSKCMTTEGTSCFRRITSGKPERNWRIMRNLRLDLCYDGTRYRGWQRLPGVDQTIQGKLEQTLSRILGEQIEISGSGRTDAGAHALGQVANFHCQSKCPARRSLRNFAGICRKISAYIPVRKLRPGFMPGLTPEPKPIATGSGIRIRDRKSVV